MSAVLAMSSNYGENRHVVAGSGRVIGRSEPWQRVLTAALRVASTETTVFLQGESGTGKEVVARFIHQASPRKTGPFVAINCAALPEQLLESELYRSGSFSVSAARARRKPTSGSSRPAIATCARQWRAGRSERISSTG